MSATERARAEEGQDAMTTFDLPALRAAAVWYVAQHIYRADQVTEHRRAAYEYWARARRDINGFLKYLAIAKDDTNQRHHEPYSDEMIEDTK